MTTTNTNTTPAKKQTRLSINLNPEAADFLDTITDKRGISYTEAVRRALALYKLMEEERDAGNHVQIDDGKKIREILVL